MKTIIAVTILILFICMDAGASITVYYGNGSMSVEKNLSAAINYSGNTTIFVDSELVVDDVIIPSNVKLKLNKGGIILVNRGKKITINGKIEAGSYQIFAGSGMVAGINNVNPVWFPDNQDGNQQAFDAVAPNGTIEFNTVRNVESVVIKYPMIIKGPGGLSQSIKSIAKDVLLLHSDNITVDGISIKGPIVAGNTNHSNAAAVNINGHSNIKIKNCIISGKQNGIQNIANPNPVSNIDIINNRVKHAGYGIVIWPTAHPAPTTKYGSNITVAGNDVRLQAGYDPTSENIRGIRVSHCDNVTIVGNKSLGAQLSIETWCDNRNRWSRNAEISSNTVDTWICLDNFENGTLKNNTVDYLLLPAIHAVSKLYGGPSGAVCGIESVYVKNILIQGNYVANQPGNGIYIGYAGTKTSNELAISSNLTIDNNVIYRCATAGASMAGLQLGLIRDSTISNNTITECGTYKNGMAINCGGHDLKPVTNLSFVNNILKNNNNSKYTFRLFGFKNIIVDNLISENNAGDGITLAESASIGFVMINSNILNNYGFGIKFSTAMKNVLIERSKVLGNKKGSSSVNGVTPDSSLGTYAKLNNNIGLQ